MGLLNWFSGKKEETIPLGSHQLAEIEAAYKPENKFKAELKLSAGKKRTNLLFEKKPFSEVPWWKTMCQKSLGSASYQLLSLQSFGKLYGDLEIITVNISGPKFKGMMYIIPMAYKYKLSNEAFWKIIYIWDGDYTGRFALYSNNLKELDVKPFLHLF